MTANAALQLAFFLALLLAFAWPLGHYMARVFDGRARLAGRVVGQTLDRSAHERLIDEYIDEVADGRRQN